MADSQTIQNEMTSLQQQADQQAQKVQTLQQQMTQESQKLQTISDQIAKKQEEWKVAQKREADDQLKAAKELEQHAKELRQRAAP